MSLTFKLGCMLLAMLCFAIATIGSRVWYGPGTSWGWAGTGFIALGLLLVTAGETFG